MRKQHFSFAAALIAALLILTAIPALAQNTTFGLSDDDFALWTNANEASSVETQFAYAFTLTLNAVDSSATASANLSGTGALDTEAQAFLLAINGTANVGTGDTPLNAEVRVVDGNFYFNATDPSTGQESGWMGDSLANLTSMAGEGFTAFGAPVDPAALSSATSGADMAALTAAFANFDASEFISIARAADEKIGSVDVAHFVVDLSLDNLFQSSSVSQMMQTAMQSAAASAPGADMSMAQMTAVLPMLSTVLQDSTVTLEQYVSLTSSLIERAVLTINLNINPAMMGQSGGTSTLELIFDINLSSFGEPPNIQAPEGAQMGALSSVMAVSEAPNIAAPSPNQQIPVPTLPVQAAATPSGSVLAQGLTANTPITVQYAEQPVTLTYVSPGNETINIIAHSVDGSLDTTLTLQDAAGTQLAFNDDHGSDRDLNNFDSLITQQNLTSAGTYSVVVSTFSGSGSGAIEVTVETQAAAQPTAEDVKGGGTTSEPVVMQGQVGNNETYSYDFNANANETVTITARATDNSLDTVLELYGPNGEIVADNDDHGTSDPVLAQYDSRISNVRLSSAGIYTIRVRGFAGASGSFELTIERGGGSTTPTNNGNQSVDTVNDTLRSGDVYTYNLTANAGDVYTITAHGLDETMDTIVEIYDADGNYLIGNDDHSSNDPSLSTYDSRITRYIFQQSGTFSVDLSGYRDASGRFELTVERVATGAPVGDGDDQIFTGEIQANGSFTQEFTAQAGSYVTVTVRALTNEFDPSVALISPDGVLLESNEDVGNDYTLGFYDARISNFMVTTSGTYTVEVTGYRSSAGSFALVVNTK